MPKPTLQWKRNTKTERPAETERSWLAFHPDERCMWLVVHGRSQRGVWRERSGAFELLAGPDELSLPHKYYPTEFLPFYDSKKKAMMLAVGNSVGGDTDLLHLARWDGKKLVAEKTKNAVLWGDDDALVFDTRRNVLVHLLTKSDWQRGEADGFLVRELHDGEWKHVGELPEAPEDMMGHLMAGFDEARGVVVWIAPDQKCFGWDGKRWDALPEIPTELTPITEEDFQKHQLTLDPKTRGLIAIAPEGKDKNEHAVAWVLGKDEWKKTKPEWKSWGAAAYDGARERVGVAFVTAKEGLTSVLAAWDGASLETIGAPVIGRAVGARAGELLCADGEQVFLLDASGASKPLGDTGGWLDAWVPTDEGFVGVRKTGDAWAVSNGKLEQVAAPPKGWTERFGMAMAWDADTSRALVTCGKTNKRRVQETWSLARDAAKWWWEKLAPKGAHPAEYRAAATIANGVLVLTGGVVDYNLTATNKTWELDLRESKPRWTKLARKPSRKLEDGERALFLDEKTGLVVFTRWDDVVKISIYKRGGTFTELATVEAIQPKPRYSAGGGDTKLGTTGPLFWDASTRSIVSYDLIDDGCSSFGRMEVALGPLLDKTASPRFR